jgi:hypothetical protein
LGHWRDGDPVAHIIGLNIHRRHLSKQQQADLIVAAIKAGEKPRNDCEVSKGGRGKVNETKAKAVAEAKKQGIDKRTVEEALAKAEGKTPKPKPKPRRPTKKELAAIFEQGAANWKAAWLRDHPGRTPEEYEQILDTEEPGGDGPMWLWRRAMGRASIEAEKAAWLRDHPGNPLPEHMCSLSEDETAEYEKWLETYEPPEISVPAPDQRERQLQHILKESDLVALAAQLLTMMDADQLRRFW